MSVPVNQRSESKLEVCVKARDLCVYTLQITANEKIFLPKFQRSITDDVYPIMTNSFIYDNYACQKGKGTDKARNRLKEFLRKYYRKNGNIGYVLQVDIKGYYPNMSHEMCESTFKKKLPEKYFKMVQTILREQYQGDKGYNAGSQLVQIAGISVLDGLDHFIKKICV